MSDPALHSAIGLRIVYRGHVQGVGFRYTTSHIAQRHPVCGYVKNLPDGSVELLVTGSKLNVDRFLDEVDATFVDQIADKQIAELPEHPSFEGFAIRR